MEFWAALCVSGGAAIGAIAFAFCLLKLLIVYEARRKPSHETDDIRLARWISEVRERRGIRGISEPAVPAVDELKTHTVCITDPPGKIAMARAEQTAWVVVVQPSESEERV
jgi:hypothetical protein